VDRDPSRPTAPARNDRKDRWTDGTWRISSREEQDGGSSEEDHLGTMVGARATRSSCESQPGSVNEWPTTRRGQSRVPAQ